MDTEHAQLGRPTIYEGEKMRPRKVALPCHLVKVASDIGDGNVSEGVRRVLEFAQETGGEQIAHWVSQNY